MLGVYLVVLSLCAFVKGNLIVETSSGKVEGVQVPSIIKNEKYYSFMGIPYAQPPIGELRFMPPKPHQGWTDVLKAKKEPTACAQFYLPSKAVDNYGFFGQEDCLRLSIHTPKVPVKDELSLPVIVYFYNEYFRLSYNGSREYGPDFFMKEEVLIVTINHRVGPMGFLSWEDDLLPGNNGIKDVILGLKWLQQNIHKFGGDPYKVTLMGNDGGAVLVDILLHSPKAKGLFSAAIMQSGTSWQSTYFNGKPRGKAIALAKELERHVSTSAQLIKEFSEFTAQQISESELNSIPTDDSRHIQVGILGNSPIIEHDHPDAVITKLPEDTKLNIDIPIMIGYTSNEGIDKCERFLQKPQYLTFADRDFLMFFPIRVHYHFELNTNVYWNIVQEIKDFYFEEGYVKISKPGEYMTYYGDTSTFYPIDYSVRKYLNDSSAPIYYYTFDYSGELNMRKIQVLSEALTSEGTWGATTGDELCYLFVCKDIKNAYIKAMEDEDSEEMKVLWNMVRMWSNFAKTGNPTPPGADVIWKPATKENKDCMVISDELKMKTNLHESRVKFWDDFIAKYREQAEDGVVKGVKDELYENVEVKLEQGVLLGKTNETFFKGQSYYVFEGIPFAEPPVGKLRFQPPVPHKGWEGKYEALENKPTCIQLNARMRNGEEFGISGSEDCLYINVYTPNLKASAPVVVFDYNDNFRTGFNGSQTYSPQFFVEEGVIVVTINHRLGVLGYLTTGDDVIPGNNGLRDFILGLEWVQKNIKDFGGDPERVTIMGSRGGATIAEILLYSEKAKGLFSAVMLQGGSVFESSYFYKNPQGKAFELGKVLEIDTDDSKILLEGLQSASAEDLLIKEIDVLDEIDDNLKYHSSFPFTPAVEPNSPNAVLKSLPEEGKIINDVPIIFGFNSREGLDLASHFLIEPRLMTHDVELGILQVPIRVDFAFHTKDPAYKEASREIIEFYFEDKSVHYGNILEYAVYAGDVIQLYAYHKSLTKLMNEVKSPIYYYMFDFNGQLNENSYSLNRRCIFPMEHWGATITDELCYLHLCSRMEKYYKDIKTLPSDPNEIKVLRKMVRLWTNFAKTRNPTPDKEDEILKNFVWEPLDHKSEDFKYLHITKNLRMKTNPMGDRIAFWDNFLEKYSKMAVDGVVRKPEIVKDEL